MKDVEQWLVDDGLFATSALYILGDRFGMEFVNWDPTTAALEIKDGFNVEPTASLLDKVNAGSALLSSDLFHGNLETFAAICNTFDIGETSPDLFIPPDIDTCLWGLAEAKLLEGEAFDEPFSPNIAKYIGFILGQAGIHKPPSLMNFAQYPEEEMRGTMEEMESDPVFFKLFWDEQEKEKQDAERYVKTMLSNLLAQLDSIPIKSNKDPLRKAMAVIRSEIA